MIGEVDFFGVFLRSELVTSGVALVLTFGVNRLLIRLGVYRYFWHQALAEVALFVIVWALVVKLSSLWFV
ncbi:protein of unknown function DUF1656 [Thiorhodococcus drewsii AZ1]|uniref:DUF1656 domain-containing protein n=1 Tax=Thiorhodococcus drewsii AZ1 TaxID=765913 RepID=G2E2P0_9GAMM|nr:DUF1656 domain-containing protein [Thiorhodococcus drewsii]EGV30594.1 protein of unknown function DUF1656 [Thiorhodococcus drewsii AZ1]